MNLGPVAKQSEPIYKLQCTRRAPVETSRDHCLLRRPFFHRFPQVFLMGRWLGCESWPPFRGNSGRKKSVCVFVCLGLEESNTEKVALMAAHTPP